MTKVFYLEPTCPSDFHVFAEEFDGRSCYGLASSLIPPSSVERASNIKSSCSSPNHNLLRPSIPSSKRVYSLFNNRYKFNEYQLYCC